MRTTTALLVATLFHVGCSRGGTATPARPAAPLPPGAIAVTVDGSGYRPAVVNARPNQPVTLVFTRTSDDGCGQELVFPELNIRRDLPLNQPVTVSFNAPATGRVGFTCGMNMYRGALVVQ